MRERVREREREKDRGLSRPVLGPRGGPRMGEREGETMVVWESSTLTVALSSWPPSMCDAAFCAEAESANSRAAFPRFCPANEV